MQQRLLAILRTVLFTVIAPGTVAGIAPWWIHRTWPEVLFIPIGPASHAGWPLIVLGVLGYLATAGAFAWIGGGTPSPTHPTGRLVVAGLHRHVRNPMYLAVLSIILGETLLWESGLLLGYLVCVFTAFNTFVHLYEEPTLARLFPEDFAAYRAAVPRWIPRRTPYHAAK